MEDPQGYRLRPVSLVQKRPYWTLPGQFRNVEGYRHGAGQYTDTIRACQEAASNVIELKDEIKFADAIDCMVFYFYMAGYDADAYNCYEPLLHAQVAVIADKQVAVQCIRTLWVENS